MEVVAEETAYERLVIQTLSQHTAAFRELKNEMIALGSTAQRTLDQATRTNGRVNGHDLALADVLARLLAIEGRDHDDETARRAKQEQMDAVKARAFGLVTALDNKLVTTLVLLLLLGAGWVVGWLTP